MIEIDMVPMSKPRQTRSDVWKKRPVILKWRAWADEIRLACQYEEFIPGNELVMEFYLPMPKSWSKKKRAELLGKPHEMATRNDLDNLIKAVMDALIKDDGCVHYLKAKKFWAEKGMIKLDNRHRFN